MDIKYNTNEFIERYKTRLLVKGYTQAYGVDYHKTFALVVKMNTLRILVLSYPFNWKLLQFHVKNVFLHGD